ncbi:MAG: hypothetical protein HGA22_06275, partial [Clostridiales bacterium]|nr:hypothetical protein [Clostridiales bacterium]
AVKVNHIDLISGCVTGKAVAGTDAYNNATNSSTKVIKTFTCEDWKEENGWYVMSYEVKNVGSDMYFRLRGSNLGFGVANETDSDGNPLVDTLVGTNTSAKAYNDLWFYSNPIFVSTSK